METSDLLISRSGGNKNIVNRSLGFWLFFFPFKHTIFGGISANEKLGISFGALYKTE